jgi:hypothetical protein
MPNAWMDGLRHDPGESAGYKLGRVRMQWCKHHDTAGTNSYNICRWGRAEHTVKASLCPILLPKVGVPWQFCEIDSLCYDAGKYNGYGPGLEVERRSQDEPLTADQTLWLSRIGLWLDAEWGIPNVRYDGPRFQAESFRGHVNHSDIASNPDGLTLPEWDQVQAIAAPTQPMVEEDDMTVWLVLEAGLKQGAHVQSSPFLIWHKRNVSEVGPGRVVLVNHAEIEAIYADIGKARAAAGM